MFAAMFALFSATLDRPDLVLSGDDLPPGAVARFGIPHKPFPSPYYPFAAGYSDEGSFRVAVPDGKDVRVWTWHAPSAQPPKHLFRGHPAEVTRLALSTDGRTLATGDKGGDLRVWDLATGDELLALEDEPSEGALAVGPRGRFVFRAGKTGCAVWETTTKKRLAFGEDKRSFVAAAFSPDGKLLVTADKAGKLELWEPRILKRLDELAWEPPPPPKEKGLFVPKLGPGGKPELPDRRGGLRDVIDPTSPEHDGGVIRIAFSADGARVITAGASVVRAWEVESRKELWRVSHSRYHTHVGGATAWTYDYGKLSGAAISADGKFVAIANVSGHVHLIDAATGKDVWLNRDVGRYDQYNAPLGVAFHPNGKWLATHAAGNYIDLWDIATGMHLTTTGGHTGAAKDVAFSPDGKHLASAGELGYLDAYDLTTRRTAGRVLLRERGNGFGFTADGKYVIAQGAAVEFTPGARTVLQTPTANSWYLSGGAMCIDPRAPARVISAGARTMVYGEDIPTKKWISYGDGKPESTIQLHDTPYEIALAPEADRLVVGTGRYYDRRAHVYDLKTGKEPFALEDNVPSFGVAITANGKLIAGCAKTGQGGPAKRQLRVWDGTTGKRKFMIDYGDAGHGSGPTFSPDGKRVAVGIGGEVILVDTATGKEVVRVQAHRGTIWRIAFSADGKQMASCADDGQTLLWNVAKLPVVKP